MNFSPNSLTWAKGAPQRKQAVKTASTGATKGSGETASKKTYPITYAAGGGGGGGRSGLINSGGAKAGTSSAPGGSTAGRGPQEAQQEQEARQEAG